MVLSKKKMAWFPFKFPAWFQASPSSAAAEAQASCQSSAGFLFFLHRADRTDWGDGGRGEGTVIRHHPTEQSSVLIRTAGRYSGLRRTAPEPRAPIPARRKSVRAAREEPDSSRKKKKKKMGLVTINQTPTVTSLFGAPISA